MQGASPNGGGRSGYSEDDPGCPPRCDGIRRYERPSTPFVHLSPSIFCPSVPSISTAARLTRLHLLSSSSRSTWIYTPFPRAFFRTASTVYRDTFLFECCRCLWLSPERAACGRRGKISSCNGSTSGVVNSPSVKRALPPVGWQRTVEHDPQRTTVWACEKTVVMLKHPGHLTSMKYELGPCTNLAEVHICGLSILWSRH